MFCPSERASATWDPSLALQPPLNIGPAVATLGVPDRSILDEYEALRSAVREIARRFRAVFDRHLWTPFVDRGMPTDQIPSSVQMWGHLTELAASVVTAELHDCFTAFAAEYVTRAEDSSRRG